MNECGSCGGEFARLTSPIFSGVPLCRFCCYIWRHEGVDSLFALKRAIDNWRHNIFILG